jgi:hypothetical protein
MYGRSHAKSVAPAQHDPAGPTGVAAVGGPDATASGFRRNKRSFFTALHHCQSSASSGVDALDLLSLRDPDV